mmetsp:Transcript_46097/g.92924  ORF Transcript_46097/g.92924 Transcript_46097/m.92924 type:complete len:124 (-) Transcript_46097:337-708(-)
MGQSVVCQHPDCGADRESGDPEEDAQIDLSSLKVTARKDETGSIVFSHLEYDLHMESYEEEPIWCEVQVQSPRTPVGSTQPLQRPPCTEQPQGKRRAWGRRASLAWISSLPRPYARRSALRTV